MFQKGAKLYGIFKNKCPQCHNGDFFVESNMFTFKNVLKIHESCSNCHLKYMIEPSFFYGAMYITYALTIAVAFVILLIGYLMGLSFVGILIFISIILTILSPLSLRLSRLIYINIFVHYDTSINKKTPT